MLCLLLPNASTFKILIYFNLYLSTSSDALSIKDSFTKYRTQCIAAGTLPATINVRTASVNKYIDIVMNGVGGFIRSIKVPSRTQIRFENKDNVDMYKIWENYTSETSALAFFIAITWGLRISEIAGLRKNDFVKGVGDNDDPYVKCKVFSGKNFKTGEVYAKEDFAFIIYEHVHSYGYNNFIFFDTEDQMVMLNSLKDVTKFKSMCEKRSNNLSRSIKNFTSVAFDEKVPAHALRRYFADKHYKGGLHIEQLSYLMRHANIQNTLLYISESSIKNSVLASLELTKPKETKTPIKPKKNSIKEAKVVHSGMKRKKRSLFSRTKR
jgi:integrase